METSHVNDKYLRPLQDLRISIMDKCNFRCSYCMPADVFGDDYVFMREEELLSFDEIERLVSQFTTLGVKKIRLTGGEPLLRKNVPDLIKRLSQVAGIEDIALTTNGVHLVKQAKALKQAGLMRVNVSLDALSTDIFQEMNGRKVTSVVVLKGIEAALEAGLEVKINMVVKKGVNESEVIKLARYCKERNIQLRFIEFMDVGQTNGWDFSQVVTKKELLEKVATLGPLEELEKDYLGEVATRYRYKGTNAEIGIISSVSDTFCGNCTRARISADGKLYTCLFAEEGYDLRSLIRLGATDSDIKSRITEIWSARTDKYSEERTEETVKNRKKIEMSYIGG
ncbi:GTP 3',8-cyclase MoaA [Alkalihalobacillus sp. MEB130]|uniref:GTP 3',8-cyclase MoaA n=1 Tax=Alkalihalobacillus sp. MEB130 TaxID=2976704 RepID=UPI0028DDD270|nr:GTP 3',8-cyclase MoaA [Alkalihalobacillus sp. MEB130]MDT8862385.1 GTP 3',8-cyclase MoaA [Alkalihalobacillus sp. MEB130]